MVEMCNCWSQMVYLSPLFNIWLSLRADKSVIVSFVPVFVELISRNNAPLLFLNDPQYFSHLVLLHN